MDDNIAQGDKDNSSLKTSLQSFKFLSPAYTRTRTSLLNKTDTHPEGRNARTRASSTSGSPSLSTRTSKKRHIKDDPSNPRQERKRRRKRGYAPVEIYEHLNFLQDYLDEELDSESLLPMSGVFLLTVFPCSYVLRDQVRPLLFPCVLRPSFPISPGCTSAEIGHHYASPTNHFWKCLYESRKFISAQTFFSLTVRRRADRPAVVS